MQIFLGLALGGTECILLGLSAFSWASCLMTDTLPSADLCTIHSWLTGLSVGRWPLAHWPVVLWMSWYTLSMRFPFCEPREIRHFYCELPSVLCLSCDDTSIYETGVLLSITILLLIPFSVTLASSHSSWSPSTKWLLPKARKKAFSTSLSHLTVVSLYYGAIIFMYMRSISSHISGQDKVVSVLYTILTPMLNLMIYSLWNKDVMETLEKLLWKCTLYSKMWM